MAGELVPEGDGRSAVPRGEVRVSDTERDAVLDELRVHLSAGRIDLSEFEERTNAVVAAKFRRDLSPILDDLPELTPVRPVGPPVRARPRQDRVVLDSPAFRVHAYVSIVISVFLLAIYTGVVIVADSGDMPFWPIFPISALGLAVGLHAAVRKGTAQS